MDSSFQEEPWVRILPAEDFDSEPLRKLHAHWNRKRGDRRMPSRGDFDPLELKDDLGWITLVDVEPDPTRFRYRLVGTNITELMGRDATGAYLDELYPASVEPVATSSFRDLVRSGTPNRVLGTMRHAERGFLSFESVDLPLSSDGQTVDMIMVRSVFRR